MRKTCSWCWPDKTVSMEGMLISLASPAFSSDLPATCGAADRTDGFVSALYGLGAGFNEKADPITWLTAYLSYDINEHFRLSLEGQNLLDAEQTYSISNNSQL